MQREDQRLESLQLLSQLTAPHDNIPRGGNVQDELAKRDQEIRHLLDHISVLISKNAELVAENSRLRGQATETLEPSTTIKASARSRSTIHQIQDGAIVEEQEAAHDNQNCTVPWLDYKQLTEKYDKLRLQYRETSKALEKCKLKYRELRTKFEERKVNAKEWMLYAENQRRKKERAESELPKRSNVVVFSSAKDRHPFSTSPKGPTLSINDRPSSPNSSTSIRDFAIHGDVQMQIAEDHSGIDYDSNLPEAHSIASRSISDNERTMPDEELATNAYETSSTIGPPPVSSRTHSDASTQDDFLDLNDRAVMTKARQEDEDVLEVVSARSLKRKRQSTKGIVVFDERTGADDSPSAPLHFKEEPTSSPPRAKLLHGLMRKETLDLDDLGSHIIATPRKRRDMEFYCRNRDQYGHSYIATLHQECSTSMPPPVMKSEPVDEVELPISMNKASAMLISSDHGLAVNEENGAISEPAQSFPTSAQNATGVLHPIDSNILVDNGEDQPLTKRQRKETDRHELKFVLISESGEEAPPRKKGFGPCKSPSAARADWNQRLKPSKGALKPHNWGTTNVTTPGASRSNRVQMPTPPTTGGSSSVLRHAHQFSEDTPSRFSKASTSRLDPQRSAQAGQTSQPDPRKSPRTDSRSPARSTNLPLRRKPLSALTLQDFKPNPAFNHGYSYAFSETVRNRDARACLPGCTKPECCGSAFHSLAATLEPLPSSQEEALLEDFLGDAYDTMRLTQMSREERDELILQARTRQLADKYGRHRHAYERQKTPPGFWRTDFPSTQEEIEDRKKAEEMHRNKLESRWMEAMRKGGRWMFRDE